MIEGDKRSEGNTYSSQGDAFVGLAHMVCLDEFLHWDFRLFVLLWYRSSLHFATDSWVCNKYKAFLKESKGSELIYRGLKLFYEKIELVETRKQVTRVCTKCSFTSPRKKQFHRCLRSNLMQSFSWWPESKKYSNSWPLFRKISAMCDIQALSIAIMFMTTLIVLGLVSHVLAVEHEPPSSTMCIRQLSHSNHLIAIWSTKPPNFPYPIRIPRDLLKSHNSFFIYIKQRYRFTKSRFERHARILRFPEYCQMFKFRFSQNLFHFRYFPHYHRIRIPNKRKHIFHPFRSLSLSLPLLLQYIPTNKTHRTAPRSCQELLTIRQRIHFPNNSKRNFHPYPRSISFPGYTHLIQPFNNLYRQRNVICANIQFETRRKSTDGSLVTSHFPFIPRCP